MLKRGKKRRTLSCICCTSQLGPARADRNARGDHILWLHPGRPPATGPGLAAAVQALQELQARPQLHTLRKGAAAFQ